MEDSEHKETNDAGARQGETQISTAAQWLGDVAQMLRFFSRLPLPKLGHFDRVDVPVDFARSGWAIPLAGSVIALPAAFVLLIGGASPLPYLAVATLCVAVSAAVTGALHEDGFGDVCDGFFGGHNKERRLEIMKDSRVGAFAAVGLTLAILLRVVLIGASLERGGPVFAAAVFLAAEAVSRSGLLWAWFYLPSAYSGGLSDKFGRPKQDSCLYGSASAGLLLVLMIGASVTAGIAAHTLGIALLLAVVASGGAVYGLARVAQAKIGGITGDVLGAMQQVGLIGFYLGLLLVI
ncbi:adenosylcobinamide-GDP ribazoletransferase [Polycladidibacter hongkongensis]|uniref:adenosylcobinamide-GDP ribazoletransferase n=1 Tax=Polycladidibacter hongkongensis TaxID=1647556 RepID=UPI000B0C6399|nr:adenosylcobinamide-GDP ribazoletransferase [Pseudovibrio hongkongensis]